jgi:DNA-binding beta-propeller fold protein YncE
VWVTNTSANSVTELSDSKGALSRVISGSKFDFLSPDAVSSDGTDVWVANRFGGASGNGTVTELSASTGGLVAVLSDSSYGFDNPDAISSNGNDVWVANSNGNSVTELSESTGALV